MTKGWSTAQSKEHEEIRVNEMTPIPDRTKYDRSMWEGLLFP